MAVSNVPSCAVSTQTNELLFSPEELEAIARLIRNRSRGFLFSVNECDVLLELVERYMGGSR
jgi:hypothetical protein